MCGRSCRDGAADPRGSADHETEAPPRARDTLKGLGDDPQWCSVSHHRRQTANLGYPGRDLKGLLSPCRADWGGQLSPRTTWDHIAHHSWVQASWPWQCSPHHAWSAPVSSAVCLALLSPLGALPFPSRLLGLPVHTLLPPPTQILHPPRSARLLLPFWADGPLRGSRTQSAYQLLNCLPP